MNIEKQPTSGLSVYNPTPSVVEVMTWKINPGETVTGIPKSLAEAFTRRGCHAKDATTGIAYSPTGTLSIGEVGIFDITPYLINYEFEPGITVVIPTYNRMELVVKAIDSARQNYPNMNIIVVDDCSSDDTVNRLVHKLLTDNIENLHLISLGRQINVSAARNLGIQMANSEWIISLDSDDQLAPNGIYYIENLLRAGNDVVYGSFEINGKKTLAPTWERGKLETAGCYMLGVRAFRKSLWAAVGGFDERLALAEDLDFLIRAEQAGANFGRVEEVLTLIGSPEHRVTSDSGKEVNSDAKLSRTEGQNRRRGHWRVQCKSDSPIW